VQTNRRRTCLVQNNRRRTWSVENNRRRTCPVQKKSKKNLPSAALPSTSPIRTTPGLNLGIRFEKKATKSLINGANLKRFTFN
jgi:hypothetical protein